MNPSYRSWRCFRSGLVQRLRYLPDEDTWQTRFLCAEGYADGTYSVRLVMRDRAGHAIANQKHL